MASTARVFPRGPNHPRWIDGPRVKKCQHCNVEYAIRPKEPYSSFVKRKFCSRPCIIAGQTYLRGEAHPNYRREARRKNRGGSHHRWKNAVISRDKAVCQQCGATEVELHAHHIKSYKDHPELRYDVANGTTLCYRCHWAHHSVLDAKTVKTGNTPPEQSEGNPVPSLKGNLLEGVTTRGRAYRRWVGSCDWCGATISKPLSDCKNKKALFCNKRCMGKWIAKSRGFNVSYGSNASTSAVPERDDIV